MNKEETDNEITKEEIDNEIAYYEDIEGYEMWDQKMQYEQKERAKMILNTLDEEPELAKEFHLELRRRKLNKIKNNDIR